MWVLTLWTTIIGSGVMQCHRMTLAKSYVYFNDVTWALRRLISPATIFFQLLLQNNNKENINTMHYCLSVWQVHRRQMDFPHKRQRYKQCFHNYGRRWCYVRQPQTFSIHILPTAELANFLNSTKVKPLTEKYCQYLLHGHICGNSLVLTIKCITKSNPVENSYHFQR